MSVKTGSQHDISVRYVGILGQAKLSGSQSKFLDRMQVHVRYVCDAGIEPESIPTYRALRTRQLNIALT